MSVTAVTVAERGPGSKSDSSPNIWPGPRIASRFSRPSEEVRPSFTLPSATTYSLSPVSPSWNSTSPRRSRTVPSEPCSAAVASSSRALNSGA